MPHASNEESSRPSELRADKLGRRGVSKFLTTALLRAGQLTIAAALIWFAFRTPDYSLWWIAQSFGTAFALYGAFKAVGVVGRWFGRGGPQHRTHSPPHDTPDTSTSKHVSFAVRVQATTAARPVIA
jgi:hypothetical protein